MMNVIKIVGDTMKATIVLIFAFFLIVTIPAWAEPTATVRWLMNEPASLFDIAMIRLRVANQTQWTPELMKKLDGKGLTIDPIGIGSVVYKLDENRITITASFIGAPTEDTCAGALREYKKIIIPSKDNWKYVSIGSYFNHVNYGTTARPSNLNTEISKLVVFTVGISEKLDMAGRAIFCSCTIEEDSPSYLKFGF